MDREQFAPYSAPAEPDREAEKQHQQRLIAASPTCRPWSDPECPGHDL